MPKSWKSVKNRGEIHWKSVIFCGFPHSFRVKVVNLRPKALYYYETSAQQNLSIKTQQQ